MHRLMLSILLCIYVASGLSKVDTNPKLSVDICLMNVAGVILPIISHHCLLKPMCFILDLWIYTSVQPLFSTRLRFSSPSRWILGRTLSNHLFQIFGEDREVFPSQLRDIISRKPLVCCWASSWLDMSPTPW